MTIFGCNPRFNVSDKIVQVIEDFARLPIFERTIDVIIRRSFCGRIWWMLKKFPSFVVDLFGHSMFNVWPGIVMVKHDVVLLAGTFGFDSDFQTIELS